MMPTTTDGQVDQNGVAAYQGYQVANTYELDPGVLVLPTCDGGGPVVIQTHDPYRVKRVGYGGVGRGRPPVMPRPADGETVLAHSHVQQLGTPIMSGGGHGYTYPCLGGYSVLEYRPVSPVADDLSAAIYECPRYPARLEPMATEAEAAGWQYLPGGTPPAGGVRLDDPNWQWPQALTVTSDFFSDKL